MEEEEKRKSVNRFVFFSRFELKFKSVLSLVYLNFLIVDTDKFKFSRYWSWSQFEDSEHARALKQGHHVVYIPQGEMNKNHYLRLLPR